MAYATGLRPNETPLPRQMASLQILRSSSKLPPALLLVAFLVVRYERRRMLQGNRVPLHCAGLTPLQNGSNRAFCFASEPIGANMAVG